MKRNLIFIVTLVSLFANSISVQAQSIIGNDKYTTTKREIGEFDKVRVSNSANVVYKQNPDSVGYMTIYCEKNILDYLVVENKKGSLNIKFNTNKKIDYGVIIVTVYSSFLTQVAVEGSGRFEAKELIKGAELQLNVVGSGQIKAETINYNILNAAITGSGDMLLKGSVQFANYTTTGSGEIQAHELVAQEVKATTSGSGNIGCNAQKTLSATMLGSGSVFYQGSPVIKSKTMGSGRAEKIEK